MNAYFQDIESVIVKQLLSAKSSIIVAVCWFTNKNLFNTLVQKRNEGIDVQVIIDNNDVNFNDKYALDFNPLCSIGVVWPPINPTILQMVKN